jgi:hypothetical protein
MQHHRLDVTAALGDLGREGLGGAQADSADRHQPAVADEIERHRGAQPLVAALRQAALVVSADRRQHLGDSPAEVGRGGRRGHRQRRLLFDPRHELRVVERQHRHAGGDHQQSDFSDWAHRSGQGCRSELLDRRRLFPAVCRLPD